MGELSEFVVTAVQLTMIGADDVVADTPVGAAGAKPSAGAVMVKTVA
jgi:hypothetical protein